MTYRVAVTHRGVERSFLLPARTPEGARRLLVLKLYGRGAYLLPSRITAKDWLPDGAVDEATGHVYRRLSRGQSGIVDYAGLTVTVYPAE